MPPLSVQCGVLVEWRGDFVPGSQMKEGYHLLKTICPYFQNCLPLENKTLSQSKPQTRCRRHYDIISSSITTFWLLDDSILPIMSRLYKSGRILPGTPLLFNDPTAETAFNAGEHDVIWICFEYSIMHWLLQWKEFRLCLRNHPKFQMIQVKVMLLAL